MISIVRYLMAAAGGIALLGSLAASAGAAPREHIGLGDAVQVSWFGERPAYSPDGKRIALVGKTYGDAYEIELATGKVRNLTAHLPHQGIMRIQYLLNGDFLITAPRVFVGEATRSKGELWVLDKGLQRGFTRLDQPAFEGVAVSRVGNHIAFAVPTGRSPTAGEIPPIAYYTADIAYTDGMPHLANKRRIPLDGNCNGEPQDFRKGDGELMINCYRLAEPGRGYWSGVYGVDVASGHLTAYRTVDTEYNEMEGIAPDGSWAAVECAPRGKAGLAAIDLCRLDLTPGGKMTPLVSVTTPGSTRKVNNPVISPDGRWMAFSTADTRYDLGSGDGIVALDLTK